MGSRLLQRDDIIIGVDTHKDVHVAAAIDGFGGTVCPPITIPATPDGYATLVAWAEPLGTIDSFGVEGCGSHGSGLTRFLRRHDYRVHEVARPPRKGERRANGKSDSIDTQHAARLVLSGEGLAVPKSSDGVVEALRLVKIGRDAAVKSRTVMMITLKTVLVTASDELRGGLEPLTNHRLVVACSRLDTSGDLADPGVACRRTLAGFALRWLALDSEVKSLTGDLELLARVAAPLLLERFGVGPDSAAELVIAAGGNSGRVRSEAAFAKMCGVCPVPTGSGKTGGRHRLFRGGNRQANAALYRIVIVRLRYHPASIAYMKRRTAEGLSKKDVIRCLKRAVVREVYQCLPATGLVGETT